MKLLNLFTAFGLALALTGCATEVSRPAADSQARDKPNPALAPASLPPPMPAAAPAAPVDDAKARLAQQKREAQQKQELDDEARRLASHQKNLFKVFKLTETLAGFRPRPNAVGVFVLKSSKSDKLRIALSQLPDSPARLSVGSYVINLDLILEYVETRECSGAGCTGKTENIERLVPRSIQIAVSPKPGYSGTREVSILDAKNGERPAKNTRVSYSNLVMTVRRMTVSAPAARID